MAAPNPLLIVVSVAWLLMLGGAGVAVAIGPAIRRQRVMRRRIGAIRRRGAQSTTAADTREVRLAKASSTGRVDDFLGRLIPRRQMLVLRLERTGRPITVTQYFGISLAIALMAGVGVGVFLKLGFLPGVLSGAFMGIGLPHFWIGRMAKKRVARFMMLLPEAMDLMVRALRSGLPISEAIVSAGHEIADPVGAEFRKVEGALRMGRQLDDVLWDTARRLDVAEFRFFVISMGVQRETGGNLAETLAGLGDMLRRRRQMKLKIKALSSEGKASAMILGSLPFVVTLAMTFTSPDYIGRMFSDPRGLLLLGIGMLWMGTGVAIMAKIINFEI